MGAVGRTGRSERCLIRPKEGLRQSGCFDSPITQSGLSPSTRVSDFGPLGEVIPVLNGPLATKGAAPSEEARAGLARNYPRSSRTYTTPRFIVAAAVRFDDALRA